VNGHRISDWSEVRHFETGGGDEEHDFDVEDAAYVISNRQNNNFGGEGTQYTGFMNDGYVRCYLNFHIDEVIPEESEVLDASLTVYFSEAVGDRWAMFVAHVLGNWDEDRITWNNKPNVSGSGTGFFPDENWEDRSIRFTITAVIQRIVNEGSDYGIILKRTVEDEGDEDQYLSFPRNRIELHVEWSE